MVVNKPLSNSEVLTHAFEMDEVRNRTVEKSHLDLKLQELHILHCLFKHSADIYLQDSTSVDL